MASISNHCAMELEQFLWAAVQVGDLEALERLSHRSVDWNKANPWDSMTPLLKAFNRAVEAPGAEEKKYFKIMEWLVRQGADPTYRFPGGWPPVKFRIPSGESREYPLSGKSVLDMVTLFENFGLIQRLTVAFLDATSSQRRQVCVDKGVVDLWERILGSTSSHNVSFQTADGPVTAHSLVLQEASPVLKAMLGSSMKEGETRQIEVRDASSSAARLFLEILYTCSSSSSEPTCEDTLAALDLAHRWQISVVVGILEEVLQGREKTALCIEEMIGEKTLWAIAEAAALKDLAKLKRACKSFIGKASKAMQTKLMKGCPKAVQELFDPTEPPALQSEKRRRRF